MATKVAISAVNATDADILNTIRANASPEYQATIPVVNTVDDKRSVGEILFGYPALANEALNSLVTRIAFVSLKSSTFNNPYVDLKKGYLGLGETIEEAFVEMAKAREFSVDKANAREFKRTPADVKAAFHVINYKAQYPITVDRELYRTAFISENGVNDLVNRIITSTTRGAEYDEYLLFKYLLIKGYNNGNIKTVNIKTGDKLDAAAKFRGVSNMLTFVKTDYNAQGVHTVTPKNDQYIFMPAMYNAEYDVNVLSSAFNMDKAEFSGRLKLIDDFTTFDNERFSEIAANSKMITEVTAAELEGMANVKAILVDKEWFQIYDNLFEMDGTKVISGKYWNYVLDTWKWVSWSPFSNAVAFVEA